MAGATLPRARLVTASAFRTGPEPLAARQRLLEVAFGFLVKAHGVLDDGQPKILVGNRPGCAPPAAGPDRSGARSRPRRPIPAATVAPSLPAAVRPDRCRRLSSGSARRATLREAPPSPRTSRPVKRDRRQPQPVGPLTSRPAQRGLSAQRRPVLRGAGTGARERSRRNPFRCTDRARRRLRRRSRRPGVPRPLPQVANLSPTRGIRRRVLSPHLHAWEGRTAGPPRARPARVSLPGHRRRPVPSSAGNGSRGRFCRPRCRARPRAVSSDLELRSHQAGSATGSAASPPWAGGRSGWFSDNTSCTDVSHRVIVVVGLFRPWTAFPPGGLGDGFRRFAAFVGRDAWLVLRHHGQHRQVDRVIVLVQFSGLLRLELGNGPAVPYSPVHVTRPPVCVGLVRRGLFRSRTAFPPGRADDSLVRRTLVSGCRRLAGPAGGLGVGNGEFLRPDALRVIRSRSRASFR